MIVNIAVPVRFRPTASFSNQVLNARQSPNFLQAVDDRWPFCPGDRRGGGPGSVGAVEQSDGGSPGQASRSRHGGSRSARPQLPGFPQGGPFGGGRHGAGQGAAAYTAL